MENYRKLIRVIGDVISSEYINGKISDVRSVFNEGNQVSDILNILNEKQISLSDKNSEEVKEIDKIKNRLNDFSQKLSKPQNFLENQRIIDEFVSFSKTGEDVSQSFVGVILNWINRLLTIKNKDEVQNAYHRLDEIINEFSLGNKENERELVEMSKTISHEKSSQIYEEKPKDIDELTESPKTLLKKDGPQESDQGASKDNPRLSEKQRQPKAGFLAEIIASKELKKTKSFDINGFKYESLEKNIESENSFEAVMIKRRKAIQEIDYSDLLDDKKERDQLNILYSAVIGSEKEVILGIVDYAKENNLSFIKNENIEKIASTLKEIVPNEKEPRKTLITKNCESLLKRCQIESISQNTR
jgi:hypothetical protein